MKKETVACFHCGLGVPNNLHLTVKFDGVDEPCCCAGCQAVAHSIIEAGLDNYYRLRTADAERAALPESSILEQLKLYDLPEVQQDFVEVLPNNRREAVLMLSGITCAACVWLIEQQLLRLGGVIRADINYSTSRMRVEWDKSVVSLSDILFLVQKTGYKAEPYDARKFDQAAQKERKTALIRLWVAGLSMMQVMMYVLPTYLYGDTIEAPYLWLLYVAGMVLTLPVMLFSATPFYRGALRDICNLRMGMDTPVAVAVLVAFLASCYALFTHQESGVYFDSISMFVFLLLGGRYLEAAARRKAADAAERLVRLLPAFCHKLVDYPKSEAVEEFVVAKLQVADVILVRPGEMISADGVVLAGESAANEALLTGESLPIAKRVGSKVVAGTLNVESPLVVEVQHAGSHTRLSHIVKLLDRALAEKPRMVELADRYASWFVTSLLLLALAVFGAWYWLTDANTALWVTVSLLVATCPCALSLATPAALAAATGKLSSDGILIAKGHALETLAHASDVVFDKTGTLTKGKLSVTRVVVSDNVTQQEALALAKALAQGSEHPAAQALLNTAGAGVLPDNWRVSGRVQRSGAGMSASIEMPVQVASNIAAPTQATTSALYHIGSADYITKQTQLTLPAAWQFTEHVGSLVYLANEERWLAAFLLLDKVKDEAAELVRFLQKMGLRCHLLSGDRLQAVEHTAQILQLDAFKARAMPEDKLQYVEALQNAGKRVFMVGDGINDAPVLSRADVSLAVAGGADVARDGADVLLLHENVGLIRYLLLSAKKTRYIIRQNLWWAMAYNAIAVPLAAMGHVVPWVAALGMSASSLLVVLNALRLCR